MPNRYQREIEEILRNMERTEPRQGLGERIRAFNRPRPAPRRGPRVTFTLTRIETLLLLGIAFAFVATGIAYYANGATYISGGFAVAGFIAIVLGLVIAWNERFRGGSRPTWRSNVVDMTPPRHRNPFSAIATQWRIFRLKLRYWRNRGKE